jgi:hypothetical protein
MYEWGTSTVGSAHAEPTLLALDRSTRSMWLRLVGEVANAARCASTSTAGCWTEAGDGVEAKGGAGSMSATAGCELISDDAGGTPAMQQTATIEVV